MADCPLCEGEGTALGTLELSTWYRWETVTEEYTAAKVAGPREATWRGSIRIYRCRKCDMVFQWQDPGVVWDDNTTEAIARAIGLIN